MTSAMRALMTDLIDYAGLFPPASLALEPAIRRYAKDRQSADAWMLGKFICPAAKFKDLSACAADLFAQQPPFHFSALGRAGDTRIGFVDNVRRDVADILAFCDFHRDRVRVDAFETRLPPDVIAAESAREIDRTIRDAEALYDVVQQDCRTMFFEVPLIGVPRKAVREAILGVDDLSGGWGRRGLKFRCGGVESAQFPSPAELAFAISEAAGLGTPMKFTAGLHHPFRHYNDGVKTHMYGFVNVFAAVMLVREVAHPDRERTAEAVLRDENPANFKFTEEGLHWRDVLIPTLAITNVRTRIALGYGSCSFDEPRDDLRTLRLL